MKNDNGIQTYYDELDSLWKNGIRFGEVEAVVTKIIETAPEEYRAKLYSDVLARIVFSSFGGAFYPPFDVLKGYAQYQAFLAVSTHAGQNEGNAQPFLALIDLVEGRNDRVLERVSAWISFIAKDAEKTGKPLSHDEFVERLLASLRNGFPGMWEKIGKLLDRDGVDKGLPFLCHALEFYYSPDVNNEDAADAMAQVLQTHEDYSIARELLATIYYALGRWGNALACFEQVVEDEKPGLLFLDTIYFNMAWCCDKMRNHAQEEIYYRKSLDLLPNQPNALNNLGYCLYQQRKYQEAIAIFSDCIEQKRDLKYAGNNMVRTLLAMGRVSEAQRFIRESGLRIAKDLIRRAESGKVTPLRSDTAEDEADVESIVDVGNPALAAKKQQFSSEKLLEDELTQRMEMGIPVFGLPLKIYRAKGAYGRQFIIPNGRMDLLAVDDKGDLWVIELKKDSGYDDVYTQIKEYIAWAEQNLAQGDRKVHGIICLNNPTEKLKRQVKNDRQIKLYEYYISYQEVVL